MGFVCSILPQDTPCPPRHFFYWLCCSSSLTGQGFWSPPDPDGPPVHTIPPHLQLHCAGGRVAGILNWQLQMWGAHLRFCNLCLARHQEVSCILHSSQICIIITIFPENGSQESRGRQVSFSNLLRLSYELVAGLCTLRACSCLLFGLHLKNMYVLSTF